MACQVTPFIGLVAKHLREPFRVLDFGCSGGIAAPWRAFGEQLYAIGFDPNVRECARLSREETLSHVEYVPAFVAVPGKSPIMAERQRLPWSRIPSHRFSYTRTQELRRREISEASSEEKTRLNSWQITELANPHAAIQPSVFITSRAIADLDYIKIDVDGTDYELLRDLRGDLTRLCVLALQVEVNFWGSESEEDNTLHNIDCVMKAAGMELMDLNHRRYSTRFLPGKYVAGIPAETDYGRIYQGDAVYFRDLAQSEWRSLASAASSGKLAKLAALYSAYGLPDCAAEILIEFSRKLSPDFPIEHGLDLLAAQAQGYPAEPMGYREYIARFEANDPLFYRGGADPDELTGDSEQGDIDLSAIGNPTPRQLWQKIRFQEQQNLELDQRWRQTYEDAKHHYEDFEQRWRELERQWQEASALQEQQNLELDQRWRQTYEDAKHHYEDLEQRWRELERQWQEASARAARDHTELDRRWQATYNEATADWISQKAEYDRLLAAERDENRRLREEQEARTRQQMLESRNHSEEAAPSTSGA